MPLEIELAHFNRIKEELLKSHKGKYALIHGENFVSAYDSPNNAYTEGIKRFGNGKFLVKHITETEAVYRNLALYLGLMDARL